MGKTIKDSPQFKEKIRRGEYGIKHVFTKVIPNGRVRITHMNPADTELALARAKLLEAV